MSTDKEAAGSGARGLFQRALHRYPLYAVIGIVGIYFVAKPFWPDLSHDPKTPEAASKVAAKPSSGDPLLDKAQQAVYDMRDTPSDTQRQINAIYASALEYRAAKAAARPACVSDRECRMIAEERESNRNTRNRNTLYAAEAKLGYGSRTFSYYQVEVAATDPDGPQPYDRELQTLLGSLKRSEDMLSDMKKIQQRFGEHAMQIATRKEEPPPTQPESSQARQERNIPFARMPGLVPDYYKLRAEIGVWIPDPNKYLVGNKKVSQAMAFYIADHELKDVFAARRKNDYVAWAKALTQLMGQVPQPVMEAQTFHFLQRRAMPNSGAPVLGDIVYRVEDNPTWQPPQP